MQKQVRALIAGFASAAAFASPGVAQAPPTPIPAGPRIGQPAPDFALAGASRYGLLKTPVRLSDYRGSTVVLAFFYQARTKG